MKAIRAHGYGGPEALQLDDLPDPRPGPGQVRIRVHAAAVNPVDCKIRGGSQRVLIRQTAPFRVGMDCSGVVDAVGSGVTKAAVGDAVMTSPHYKSAGTYAELVCVSQDEVAPKPASISHVEAAGIPLAGLTALQCLRATNVQAGQRVLIQAGAGGVGTFAIQLARHLDAHVVTTCSASNTDLVRGLGAAEVIDYHAVAYDEVLSDLDMVLDALGGPHRARGLSVLRKGGRMACIVTDIPALVKAHGPWLGTARAVARMAWVAVSSRLRGTPVHYVVRTASGVDLTHLSALVDAGTLRPVVDKVFGLSEAADAHRRSETGRARGKIVLQVV